MSPGRELTPEIMPAPRAQIFTPEACVTEAGLGGAAMGSSTSQGTGVPHREDTAGRVMGQNGHSPLWTPQLSQEGDFHPL